LHREVGSTFRGLAQTLTGAFNMQPRDEKAEELYLTKVKTKQRLRLLKTCFGVIKILVPLLSIIDKHWMKIIAFFHE
jgi:hypothetical protein